ncbi:tripartite tricarboxylate transporter substrate binding protein [uncultured Ramlibacter sp.]|uniref:Bug family tripartite tricarboxylate transporter substrate binding protein n=1 Tax=uncultured Ramlibacter sp. TaxID=260755 RepID=UPI00260D4313|nr:tripartite tricarboxylate transporter substrate binding protein [uncultured Ramlibacter sp.]
MTFRRLLVVAALACAVPVSFAQTWPARPIKIIVAYAAGQGTDIATRYMAEQLAKELGQSVVIDNKPGAGGNLGTELAAQAPADGYTLTMGTNATHALNQFLYPSLRFDAERDFEPVALIGTFPMMLVANAKSNLRTMEDVVAAAKSGQRSADIAIPSTTARLVVELLKERSGAALFFVPYKGSGNAMTDVLGGQLPLIVDTPTALRTHITSGSVRAIAVTSAKPSGLAPGVKTVAEQGFAGYEVVAWNALYAPRGTPAPVIASLNAAITKVMARPETRQKLLDIGFDPAGGTPAQLAEFAQAERKKWGPIIKASGIKVD